MRDPGDSKSGYTGSHKNTQAGLTQRSSAGPSQCSPPGLKSQDTGSCKTTRVVCLVWVRGGNALGDVEESITECRHPLKDITRGSLKHCLSLAFHCLHTASPLPFTLHGRHPLLTGAPYLMVWTKPLHGCHPLLTGARIFDGLDRTAGSSFELGRRNARRRVVIAAAQTLTRKTAEGLLDGLQASRGLQLQLPTENPCCSKSRGLQLQFPMENPCCSKSRGLQLQFPMESPCCGCKLTRVPVGLQPDEVQMLQVLQTAAFRIFSFPPPRSLLEGTAFPLRRRCDRAGGLMPLAVALHSPCSKHGPPSNKMALITSNCGLN